jgi:hypothetical protein
MENCAPNQYQQGPMLSITIDPNGYRIHTLIDDTVRPIRSNRTQIQRDPMVEALFGPAKPARR